MKSLKHDNNTALCIFYDDNDRDSKEYGPILTFNVQRKSGEIISYTQFEKISASYHFILRTGCFCNPGACHDYLQINLSMLKQHYLKGHKCWNDIDLINNQATGCIRISIGLSTTKDHIDQFYQFLKHIFLNSMDKKVYKVKDLMTITLKSITLYPIKSCLGMTVKQWPCGSRGLLYDRYWSLMKINSFILTQKRNTLLTQIQPFIDLKQAQLIITFKGNTQAKKQANYHFFIRSI